MSQPAPLKIFHVLLSKGFAGSERSTAESCNQQCQHHDVTLIIRKGHRRHGASIVDHLDPRIRVKEISANWLVSWQLKRLIEHFQPDVIHTHLRRSARVVAKIQPRAATLSTLHIGLNSPYFTQLDGIICNARWQLEEIPTNYSGLTFKANNSVQPHRRLNQDEIQSIRESLGVSTNTYLMGAVGRYHPSKAWDTLIKAFKQLEEDNDVKLLFFGAGSQEAELKALAAGDQRIEFLGYRSDVKDLYQTFDLALCPSRFEPLPRVILEAMDAGTPVLASDAGGCQELIEDYGGHLFKVDDVEDLLGQLRQCIAERPERHQPDLSAHHVVNANQAIEGFYRQLIERKRVS